MIQPYPTPITDEVIAPRVDAEIAFLKSKGVSNIVLIGRSMGATMVSCFMANRDIVGKEDELIENVENWMEQCGES